MCRRVDFLKSLGGSNSVTRTFFRGILRTLLALFVHCRFFLKCLYVAIAHLMQFCFFFGVMPFRKLSVQYFGKGKKKLIATKSGLMGIKGYLEKYNRVKYFLRYFLNATSFTLNFWGGFWTLISMSRLRKL